MKHQLFVRWGALVVACVGLLCIVYGKSAFASFLRDAEQEKDATTEKLESRLVLLEKKIEALESAATSDGQIPQM
jgi:hypothetical protein